MIYAALILVVGLLAWMSWEIICICIEVKVEAKSIFDEVLAGRYQLVELEKELKELRREVDLVKQQTKQTRDDVVEASKYIRDDIFETYERLDDSISTVGKELTRHNDVARELVFNAAA